MMTDVFGRALRVGDRICRRDSKRKYTIRKITNVLSTGVLSTGRPLYIMHLEPPDKEPPARGQMQDLDQHLLIDEGWRLVTETTDEPR